MEEFNIQGNQTPFYKYSPGTFGYTLVLRRRQEALVVRLNFVFFTDSVSELYGQRMYNI
jgi:hypothetical protein